MKDNGLVTQVEYKLEAGVNIVSRTDLQGNIVYANDAFIEASGYSWTEIVGQPHNILRHPDVPAAVFKDFWETLKAGKPWSQTVKNRRKNGDHYWVVANAAPVFEKDEVVGYISVRVPASEKEIVEAEQAYQAIARGDIKLTGGRVVGWLEKISPLNNFNPSTLIGLLLILTFFSAVLPLYTSFLPEIVFKITTIVLLAFIWYVSWSNQKLIQNFSKVLTSISGGNFKNKIDVYGSTTLSMAVAQLKSMQIKLGDDLDSSNELLKKSTRIQSALKASSSSVLVADSFKEIIFVNDAAEKLLKAVRPDINDFIPSLNSEGSFARQSIDAFFGLENHPAVDVNSLKESLFYRIEKNNTILDLIVDPIFSDEGKRIGTVIELKDMTDQVSIELNIEKIVSQASTGVLKNRIDTKALDEGFELKISNSINSVLDSFSMITAEISSILTSMSDGDLNRRMDLKLKGEMMAMKTAINNSLRNIEMTLAKVKQGSSDIANLAEEVSLASEDLSARTQQQAASLEETSSSLEELNASVQHSSDKIVTTNELTKATSIEAEAGVEVMKKTIVAMDSINKVSSKIGEITAVIDSLAFQTNLLALNAAVEAARAGDHGRGFAVVAGEVRSLAQKSADSAKEIKDLITEASLQVNSGSKLVNETSSVFQGIVGKIHQIKTLVGEVSVSSSEQAIGIDQVNVATVALDGLTQQNAALVEELSATAFSLNEQSVSQSNFIKRFKISDSAIAQVEKGLDISNTDFEEAKQSHRAWKVTFDNALVGAVSEGEQQDISDYQNSGLGLWIYGKGQQYANNPIFKELEAANQKIHALALAAIELKGTDEDGVFKNRTELKELSANIYQLIDDLESFVQQENLTEPAQPLLLN